MRLFFVVLTGLLLLSPGYSPAGERETVVFADEIIAPFTYGTFGDSAVGGKTLDMLEEVFSRLDMNVDLKLMPWARAMKSAQYGRVDGLPLLSIDEHRSEFLVFTEAILESRCIFYFRKRDTFSFGKNGLPKLQNARIGLVKGYNYGRDIEGPARRLGHTLVYSLNSEAGFRKLVNDRVDVVLDIEVVAQGVFAENPLWSSFISAAGQPYSELAWHMGISTFSPLVSRLDDINEVLREMRGDGTLEKVFMSGRER